MKDGAKGAGVESTWSPDDPTGLTPVDEQAVQLLQPKKLLKHAAFKAIYFAVILGGVQGWAAGDISAFFRPGVLIAGACLGVLTAVMDLFFVRQQLRKTSAETREQLAANWRLVTAPGWPLRLVGLCTAMSVGFTTFAFVLTALFEELPSAGEMVFEFLRLTGLGAAILVPAGFLGRWLLVRRLRRPVEEMGDDG